MASEGQDAVRVDGGAKPPDFRRASVDVNMEQSLVVKSPAPYLPLRVSNNQPVKTEQNETSHQQSTDATRRPCACTM